LRAGRVYRGQGALASTVMIDDAGGAGIRGFKKGSPAALWQL